MSDGTASFYNTTHETEPALSKRREAAEHQDEVVLRYVVRKGAASPWEVHRALERDGYRWPITSIRRAMTNLAADGRLVKTEAKTQGAYGMPEHVWACPA